MYLNQIISYGNAWNTLVERFPKELDDIQAAVFALTPESIALAQPLRDIPHYNEPGISRYRLDGCWSLAIQERGWEESSAFIQGAAGRRIHMRSLGHLKNQVSVVLQQHREIVNRWLYTIAPIATRNGLIEVPISISLMQHTQEFLFGRRPLSSSLERTKEELLALSPLSHANPFILIGITLEDEGQEIFELEAEDDGFGRHVVINRSIEFPPEYHQAGLGILSYFGTVLREKYPDHNVKVRIEQDGLRVRLVIESENGDKEVIEKALQEYELVVRGETPPEEFFSSKAKVLELKNELRIAQVRIESQKDLIAYQGEEIANLRQLIGHSLSASRTQPITISVNPAITVNTATAVQLQKDAPRIAEYVQELAQLATNYPDIELRLLDLEESFANLAAKQTPEEVKESGAMKKLKSWLDDAGKVGSTANDFLGKVNTGIELAQKIARRYNALAEWSGAPQVPSVLLGDES